MKQVRKARKATRGFPEVILFRYGSSESNLQASGGKDKRQVHSSLRFYGLKPPDPTLQAGPDRGSASW